MDDLGVWYTDWGAEKLGGFLHPYHTGKGKLYNKWIIERNRGQRDVDGFLFYLGYDDAPLDNSDYILTVRGQKTPRLQVQTFYDLSNLDDYIAEFEPGRRLHRVPDAGKATTPMTPTTPITLGPTPSSAGSAPLPRGPWARCWAPAKRESTTWSSAQVTVGHRGLPGHHKQPPEV